MASKKKVVAKKKPAAKKAVKAKKKSRPLPPGVKIMNFRTRSVLRQTVKAKAKKFAKGNATDLFEKAMKAFPHAYNPKKHGSFATASSN